MEEKELDLEELENAFGGISREAGIEKALETPASYRQKMIEELKKEKTSLEQSQNQTQSQGRPR